MKTCPKCGESKPIGQFYKSKNRTSGRKSYCKSCDHAISEAWKKANPQRARELHARWNSANPEIYVGPKLTQKNALPFALAGGPQSAWLRLNGQTKKQSLLFTQKRNVLRLKPGCSITLTIPCH